MMKRSLYAILISCLFCVASIVSAQGGRFYTDFDARDVIDIATIEKDLPAHSSFVAGLHIHYPEGWIISEVEVSDMLKFAAIMDPKSEDIYDLSLEQTVTILSPEIITSDILASYIIDEVAPPMLSIIYPTYHKHRGCYCDYYVELNARKSLVHNFPRLSDYGTGHFRLSILTNEEDWILNQGMYQAMLQYPSTFEYYLHEDLRYSIFTTSYRIGFPEGWIGYIPENIYKESAYFVPEEAEDVSLGVSLTYLPDIDSWRLFETEDDINIWFDEFVAEYGIIEESQQVLRGLLEPKICALTTPPLRFENNEEYGYLISHPYTLVKLSARQNAEIEQSIVDAMVESLTLEDGACG